MKKISSVFSLVLICVLLIGQVSFAANSGNKYIYPNTYGPYTGPVSEPGVFSNVVPNGYNYAPNSNNGYVGNGYQYLPQYEERVMEKGWHLNSTGRYYCKGDGDIFRNGWYWIDGKNYFFDATGYVYRNQWVKDNYTGSWYFVDTDGASVTGWQHIDNVWYYFNPEAGNLYGVMARNTVMFINGGAFGTGFFAFNNEGAIIVNSWYGGHYYGPNGARQY